jgi:hypothetical protein
MVVKIPKNLEMKSLLPAPRSRTSFSQRLRDYWGSSFQREKAEKMTIARKQVKNVGNVGRKGKDGKEADLVSHFTLQNPPQQKLYLIFS